MKSTVFTRLRGAVSGLVAGGIALAATMAAAPAAAQQMQKVTSPPESDNKASGDREECRNHEIAEVLTTY